VYIYGSYHKIKSGGPFLDHPVEFFYYTFQRDLQCIMRV